MGLRIKQIKQS